MRTIGNSDRWGAAIILIKGLTPIPFKVVTIASGFAAYNFPIFLAASLVTRGARYFLLAWGLQRFGVPVQAFIGKRINLVGTLALALIAGGFALAFAFGD